MTKRPIQIRKFDDSDQKITRELVLSGLSEHFGFLDPSLNSDLDDIKTNFLLEGHEFVVAEVDETIIGVGGMLTITDTEGQIVRVSVQRNMRGSGIGQAIVMRLIQIARNRNFCRIMVETNLDWKKARTLYERCGFLVYAHDRESVFMELIL